MKRFTHVRILSDCRSIFNQLNREKRKTSVDFTRIGQLLRQFDETIDKAQKTHNQRLSQRIFAKYFVFEQRVY
jgi:hypothetical protein